MVYLQLYIICSVWVSGWVELRRWGSVGVVVGVGMGIDKVDFFE